MDEGTQEPTVESINAQIDQLRRDSAPSAENQYNHTGARKVAGQISELYKKRAGLDGTSGDMHAAPTKTLRLDADGNIRDVQLGGRSRLSDPRPHSDALAAAKEAGLDISNIDPKEMTPERTDGLRHLTMIKQGDLQGLGPELSKAATELGIPAKTIRFLEQFTSGIAEAGDPLSNAVLETIANYIYDQKVR